MQASIRCSPVVKLCELCFIFIIYIFRYELANLATAGSGEIDFGKIGLNLAAQGLS